MREQAFDTRTEQPLDVLVIGGGIVGAGVARDAAMRGLKVALVEQHDFASGTSGRSTRLIHGGLRYLSQGRIGLVRQAAREKTTLRQIAPHLVQPLRFDFPTYRHTHWPKWRLRVGVKLYDLLCGGKNLGPSGSLTAAQVRQLLPALNDADLSGGVYYFDALTHDARLVIDTLRSAARYGAVLRNYTQFVSAQRIDGLWQCHLALHDGSPFDLACRCIVNAAGPWADQLPQSRVKLRLTKGVHLVLPAERLPVAHATVVTRQHRILFAIPWGQRVFIGTTDTDYAGSPESPEVTDEDIAYLLEVFNHTFAQQRLKPEDIISTWAGVRPLIQRGRGRPSEISRAHKIRARKNGWIDVAGGKLTTYRLIAQEVVDKVVWHTGRSTLPCRTGEEPLLIDKPHYSGVLPPPLNAEVIEYFCRNEWVVHLEDIMLRRAGWHQYFGSAEETVRQVAQWMGQSLDWDAATIEMEANQYLARITTANPQRQIPAHPYT